jgi:hypothetical protein
MINNIYEKTKLLTLIFTFGISTRREIKDTNAVLLQTIFKAKRFYENDYKDTISYVGPYIFIIYRSDKSLSKILWIRR